MWLLSDLTLAAGLVVVGVTIVMGVTGILVYHKQKASIGPTCANSPLQNAYLLASFGAFWSVVASALAMLALGIHKKVTTPRFVAYGSR